MGAKSSTSAGVGGSPEPAHAHTHAHASSHRSRAMSTSGGTTTTDTTTTDMGVGVSNTSSSSSGGGRSISVIPRDRARSLSSVPDTPTPATPTPLSIPSLLSRGVAGGGVAGVLGDGGEEEWGVGALGRVFATHSLPGHLWSFNGFQCPICSKVVLPDDLECHLVICLTKPRISYNEDVLSEGGGGGGQEGVECVICLEELSPGDTIARLPCLCVYHKQCIDHWFQVNRSCPEHPYD